MHVLVLLSSSPLCFLLLPRPFLPFFSPLLFLPFLDPTSLFLRLRTRSGGDSFVNVVVFSENARVLLTNSTTLVRANSTNVEELVGLVQNLEVSLLLRVCVACAVSVPITITVVVVVVVVVVTIATIAVVSSGRTEGEKRVPAASATLFFFDP